MNKSRRFEINKISDRTKDYILLVVFIIALMFGITQRAKEIYQNKEKANPLSNFVIR
jgi:hypothetical protein